jgi:hypothetical protein
MSQERDAPGLFDLVSDPVIVANSFEGDRSSFWVIGKEFSNGTGLVIDPGLLNR